MISPLASIAPGAKIGKNVIIQPFAYIEDNVEIGERLYHYALCQCAEWYTAGKR